jgi:hypothetical protein
MGFGDFNPPLGIVRFCLGILIFSEVYVLKSDTMGFRKVPCFKITERNPNFFQSFVTHVLSDKVVAKILATTL